MNGIRITETCACKGCGKRTLFHPVVKAWAKGYDKRTSEPMRVEVGMGFCEEHKSTFRLEDIPDLAAIVQAAARAGRVAPPDTDTMEIEIVPIVLHDQR